MPEKTVVKRTMRKGGDVVDQATGAVIGECVVEEILYSDGTQDAHVHAGPVEAKMTAPEMIGIQKE